MNHIYNFISSILKEDNEKSFGGFEKSGELKGILSDEAIKLLVKKYALSNKELKWKVANLEQMYDLDDVYAAYDENSFTIYINPEFTKGDFHQLVESILHEIQHFNQHYKWETDFDHRLKYVKDKKIPDDIKEDIEELMLLDISSLHDYWENVYGYEQAPHERDSRLFAARKKSEAIELIMSKELLQDPRTTRKEISSAIGKLEKERALDQEKTQIIIKQMLVDDLINKSEAEFLMQNSEEFRKTNIFKQYEKELKL